MSLVNEIKRLRDAGVTMQGAVDLAKYDRAKERLDRMREKIALGNPNPYNLINTLIDHIEELYEHVNLGTDLGRSRIKHQLGDKSHD